MHRRGRARICRRLWRTDRCQRAGRDDRAHRSRDGRVAAARGRIGAGAHLPRYPANARRARALRARYPPHLPVRSGHGASHRMTQTNYASLAGRVVLITGGASGIGAAFVRAFAAQQASVAFLDLDAEAGEALARDVKSECGPAPAFVPCDLLDIAALRAALEKVRGVLGDASVLVNNAANDRRQVLSDVTPDEFDWMINVNLR